MTRALINRGLFMRSLRECVPITLLLAIALLFFEGVLAYVIPTFQAQFSEQLAQMPFIQRLIEMLLGAELSESIGPEGFIAFPWTHPVILAIFFAHALVVCTRVPAGEVDRGTIDVLFSWPVSRWTIFVSESAVWALTGAALVVVALIGNRIGNQFVEPAMRTGFARCLMVLPNLLLLYLAVGALTWVFSAMSDRRGAAMAAAFLIVMVSFLLNFIAPFWSPAKSVSFLSVMEYYRPFTVFTKGTWPIGDMIVLAILSATFWIAAGVVLARRDLAAG